MQELTQVILYMAIRSKGASQYWDDVKQKYDIVAGQLRGRDEVVGEGSYEAK